MWPEFLEKAVSHFSKTESYKKYAATDDDDTSEESYHELSDALNDMINNFASYLWQYEHKPKFNSFNDIWEHN